MADVSVSGTINAPAEKVWQVVRDFNGLPKWARGILESNADGNVVGSVRTIKTADGRTIEERLETLDDATRTLAYSIIGPPMPFNDYLATIAITPAGENACSISWGCTFEPTAAPVEALAANFEKTYSGGIKGLAAYCEKV